MPFRLQVRFWIGALVVAIGVLWLLRGILLPFVAGIALAYFLNPIVTRLARVGVGRTPSSLLIVGMFIMLIVLFLLVVLPLLSSQLFEFIQNMPSYVTRLQGLVTEENREWINHFFGDRLPDIQRSLSDVMSQGVTYLLGLLTSLWSGGQAVLSVFALMVVTPVVVFYVLCDWTHMLDTVDSWIPVHQRPVVRRLGAEMDLAVAGFIRGQALVCLILGTFYAVALTMAGLNFGLLIGIVSGLITFIPYVGSLTGLVLAMGVAVVQFFPDWTMIGVVLGIFVTGQTIEGYVLSPKLVGDSIGVHPVWLMFSLFAFGYLFGFVGLLLAVPLTAAAGVLVRFGFSQYFHSPLYTGAELPEDEDVKLVEHR
ncbi:AI-2E family transporter [Aquabacter spiritensis]|uniref:Putative PurR-regulated permease PerM n=1 Tax=Aquabacter spiritensis TaxID=933073 RepID=A0A4R3M4F1_9HYPH|nr:AI-2E family transporter [Aquabacter spiritensis]TCT08194.1 putative PurR-regulated permease PerM [Aquabacter spiritensis]